MNASRLLFICAALAGLWLVWPMFRPAPPALAPSSLQADGQSRVNGYRITPLQSFVLEGRVLGREDYRLDRGAELSPTDLVMGWGPMADLAVSSRIDINQSNRWYYWRTDNFPIPRREIETHSANMHLIPATPAVAAVLADIDKGQRIRITGQLVQVEGDDGFRWVSSLSREDTGAGACELIWVEQLTHLD